MARLTRKEWIATLGPKAKAIIEDQDRRFIGLAITEAGIGMAGGAAAVWAGQPPLFFFTAGILMAIMPMFFLIRNRPPLSMRDQYRAIIQTADATQPT